MDPLLTPDIATSVVWTLQTWSGTGSWLARTRSQDRTEGDKFSTPPENRGPGSWLARTRVPRRSFWAGWGTWKKGPGPEIREFGQVPRNGGGLEHFSLTKPPGSQNSWEFFFFSKKSPRQGCNIAQIVSLQTSAGQKCTTAVIKWSIGVAGTPSAVPGASKIIEI